MNDYEFWSLPGDDLLGGGIGNTNIGKLGGDKLLSKGLIGGLLK